MRGFGNQNLIMDSTAKRGNLQNQTVLILEKQASLAFQHVCVN